MRKTELLELLLSTKKETLHYFDCSDADLQKSYDRGKWNVRQILHHLTDTEFLFLGRLKKIIAEPRQVIWAFNQDEWNSAFNYLNEPLKNKKIFYSLCRDMNYHLIEAYHDSYSQKEFIHSETGLRTLKMEFEKVALHNQTHIVQIKTALKQ